MPAAAGDVREFYSGNPSSTREQACLNARQEAQLRVGMKWEAPPNGDQRGKKRWKVAEYRGCTCEDRQGRVMDAFRWKCQIEVIARSPSW
ncbi:hypothetical protein OIK40_11065 [Erythrobacter sp. sf7]|uniref:Uncharacterized protein n=1 Tax=Erythrobacter fulvus TaxID=2987523 RepID=A0ABT5JR83_9SPHN|nr:hypothetical protein [Erythrobacter fulvus]MDC8755178.1 hypothetical protein [Erythrobacter fulvus]